jgi:hypothetical protein
MMAVFAEFERSMMVEGVNAGLARAKAPGVKLGRNRVGSHVEDRTKHLRGGGMGILKIGREVAWGPVLYSGCLAVLVMGSTQR